MTYFSALGSRTKFVGHFVREASNRMHAFDLPRAAWHAKHVASKKLYPSMSSSQHE